jgi:hypothetical protein
MQINSSNLNFKARMVRNPDIFGYEKTKQETLSVYDAEINRIRALKKQAKEFAEYWKDKGYEKGQNQKFWLSFLRDI